MGQGPQPPELAKAYDCLKWHSLPRRGSWGEQDAGEMLRLTVAMGIYEVYSAYISLPIKDFVVMYPNGMKVITEVDKLWKEEREAAHG